MIVVASVTPNSAAHTLLKQRECVASVNVNPMTAAESKEMLHAWLRFHGKTLNTAHTEAVLKSRQVSLPLHLHSLINELIAVGFNDKFDNILNAYVRLSSLDALFNALLGRWELDCGGVRVVRNVMTALWASRRGLSEAELMDVAGVSCAQWMPLFFAVSEQLFCANGQLLIVHDGLKHAVEQRYLQQTEADVAADAAAAASGATTGATGARNTMSNIFNTASSTASGGGGSGGSDDDLCSIVHVHMSDANGADDMLPYLANYITRGVPRTAASESGKEAGEIAGLDMSSGGATSLGAVGAGAMRGTSFSDYDSDYNNVRDLESGGASSNSSGGIKKTNASIIALHNKMAEYFERPEVSMHRRADELPFQYLQSGQVVSFCVYLCVCVCVCDFFF